MALVKCQVCDLALNRPGEKRPGTRCKDCKKDHCYKCAEVTGEFCEMRGMGKDFWQCKKCESKGDDMKTVIESMKLIKSELGTIRQSQEEQQTEREQVLEGLKAVEAVVKKLDRIEAVQETHEQRISTHDEEIKTNSLKREEGEKRIKKLEDQVRNIDPQTFDLRQCNAVAKEVREIEKKSKKRCLFQCAGGVRGGGE